MTRSRSTSSDSAKDLSRSFFLVYQPIVRLRDLAVVAHECFVRRDGENTAIKILAEAAFLNTLESLDEEVVRQARNSLESWPDLRLFINLSEQTFLDGKRVRQLLKPFSRRVWLEIPEGEWRRKPASMETFRLWREERFNLVLDDVADPGEIDLAANLAPITVKTRADLVSDASRLRRVVSRVRVHLCAVVVEGIETDEHIRTARAVGADFVQGYRTGKPQAEPVRAVCLAEGMEHGSVAKMAP